MIRGHSGLAAGGDRVPADAESDRRIERPARRKAEILVVVVVLVGEKNGDPEGRLSRQVGSKGHAVPTRSIAIAHPQVDRRLVLEQRDTGAELVSRDFQRGVAQGESMVVVELALADRYRVADALDQERSRRTGLHRPVGRRRVGVRVRRRFQCSKRACWTANRNWNSATSGRSMSAISWTPANGRLGLSPPSQAHP